ncbi:MAG: hypothetical protein H0X51_07080 [Parachlamydiaceae bacterium]|nr:hypothetical protein [Parachlamydiaceae bacterium]
MSTGSVIPQAIFYLGSKVTPDNALLAAAGTESFYYSNVKANALDEKSFFRADKVVKWIRETAVAHINTIQTLFNLINFSAICYLAYKLTEEIQKYNFTAVVWLSTTFFETFPVIIVAGLAFGIGGYINHRYKKSLPPAEERTNGQVTITEGIHGKQTFSRYLHITKSVVTFTMLFFAKNRFGLVLGLIGSGYSFFKNENIKWINFSRTWDINNGTVRDAKVTYHMLKLSPSDPSTDDCAICLSNEPQLEMAFCTSHLFHTNCIGMNVEANSHKLLNNARFTRVRTETNNNGSRSVSYHYDVTLEGNNLPACPTCRAIPQQNGCSVEVFDWEHMKTYYTKASINRGHPSKFESFYAAYNVFQASLTYLQKYPELAAGIYKIQKLMLVTDAIGLVWSAGLLIQRCVEKFCPADSSRSKKCLFVLAVIIGIVATSALSYFVILQLNAYLKSAVILKDLLQKLPIPAESLKGVSVDWTTPSSFQMIQTLFLSRIIVSVALACFSKNRRTNLVSAVAQILGFANISSLRWIGFSQTLQSPLNDIVKSGGSHTIFLDTNSMERLYIDSEFMVNSTIAAQPAKLQPMLSSIQDYMSKLLDKSHWNRYWNITRNQYGMETDRALRYGTTLQKNVLQAVDGAAPPFSADVSMVAYDSFYQKYAIVEIS